MWLKRKFGAPQALVEQLGALESELMERIWARGETSVRDLHNEIAPRLAYTTVMTTLDRLFKKGLLDRRALGRAFYYTPTVSKRDYNQQLAQHLFGIAVEESGSKQALLSCFVDYVTDADRKLLDDLDELVKAKKRTLRLSK
ncbi:MAG: CopY family transcriptional regulator [Acidobacteria bacterium]|nr:MAG: CopY family transcriptional regulator [Acidobacteriota bacterium]PYY22150.1 MAG: CopY family transcriptional regulator [Acidobacteriota bacterium]